MKKIIITLAMAFAALSLMARPAYPGTIKLVQPDGSTLTVRIHGDEWGHWMTDAAGRVVAQDEDGFYRVQEGVTAESVMAAAQVRRQARRSSVSGAAKASGHVAVGQKHFLVILCQFKDKSFTTPNINAAVTAQLNNSGYSGNGATGSARDFYYDSSNGYFEPIFDVFGPVTLDNNMSYYGANDSYGDDVRPEEAVTEGCKKLDDEIDFKNYDLDKDGYVDMIFMIYAGYGEADGGGSNTIWPHQWELGGYTTLDGKKLDSYACSNELAGQGALQGKLDGIGAVCHEFGHAMGLPDFYDVDYSTNGECGGMYDFSTMDAGSYNNESRTPPYFNTEERILLGWVSESEAYQEFTGSGSVTIPAYRPENGSTVAYRTPTDMDGEYFVYECRGSQGWDSALAGHGLMVYHVDKSSRNVKISNGYGTTNVSAYSLWNNWEEYNSINENGSHPCCYVIAAKSQGSLNYSGGGNYMVFPGGGGVKSYTAKSWNGVESEYPLSNIAYGNQASTFTVTVPVPETPLDYPVIANPGNGVYSAGSSFTFALEESSTRPSASVVWYFDGAQVESASKSLTAGKHTIEAVVTLESGRKDTVTLEIQVK